MAESLGQAVLDLRTNHQRYNKEIDNAKGKAEDLDKAFGDVQKSLKDVGKSLTSTGKTLSTFVTAPLVAAGAAAFKLAADATESSNKFEVVMGGAADRVRGALKELEATTPLTTGEMLNLAAGVQDMLVPMGLARDAGADMSAQMVGLAGDIAAFNNTTPAQVINDMKSALAGSSEPLFKYGVDTRVAALESVALANGLIKQGEELDNAARAQAVLLQIQAQSTDAMGAAAREADGAAQSTQFLFRELKQLGEEIGQILIPLIVPLIQGLRDVVTWFRELSPRGQEVVVMIGGLAAAIGPVLIVVGKLFTALGAIAGVVAPGGALAGGIAAITGALMGPVGLALAVGAVALAVSTFLTREGGAFDNWMAGTTTTLQELVGDVKDLNQAFKEIGPDIQIVNSLADEFRGTNSELFSAIREGINSGKNYNQVLDELLLNFEEGTTEGDALRAKIDELGGRYVETAAAAETFNVAATTTNTVVKEQDELLKGLGFTLESDVITGIDDLSAAWATGLVPAEQMIERVRGLEEEYRELGVLTPEVEAKLASLRAEMAATGAGFLTAAEKAGIFKRALATFNPEFEDTSEILTDFDVTLPKTVPKLNNFFGEFETGIGPIDSALGSLGGFISKGLGGLDSALGGLLGKFGGGEGGGGFFGKLLGGLTGGLTGGTGEGGGMFSGILGSLGGLLGGPIGGMITGLLGKGIGALGSLVGRLFGGPSEAEKEGRNVAARFRDSMRTALDPQVLEVVHQQFSNTADRQNAAFLASIAEQIKATGVSAEKAGEMARTFGTQLWEAEKEGGAAVESVINKINEATSKMIEDTATAVNEAAGGMADVAEEGAKATNDVVNSTKTAAQETVATWTAARDGISRAFEDFEIDIPIDFSGNAPSLGGGGGAARGGGGLTLPGFAKGGMVSGPKGKAQIAVVHGGEEIRTPAQQRGGGSLQIPLTLDGREITRAVIRLTPEVRDRLGI